jgi:hypothetical protein
VAGCCEQGSEILASLKGQKINLDHSLEEFMPLTLTQLTTISFKCEGKSRLEIL